MQWVKTESVDTGSSRGQYILLSRLHKVGSLTGLWRAGKPLKRCRPPLSSSLSLRSMGPLVDSVHVRWCWTKLCLWLSRYWVKTVKKRTILNITLDRLSFYIIFWKIKYATFFSNIFLTRKMFQNFPKPQCGEVLLNLLHLESLNSSAKMFDSKWFSMMLALQISKFQVLEHCHLW